MTKNVSTGSLARLASSLTPRRNTLESQRIMSAVLFAQQQARRHEIGNAEGEQDDMIGIELGEAARLGDRSEADVLEPERGKAHADETAAALQGRGRIEIAGEVDRGDGANDGGDDD